MDRRTFIRASAVTGAAASVAHLAAPLRAEATAGGPVRTTNLGPASLACTTLHGGFVGARPYIVSHLLAPAHVGVFDTAAGGTPQLAVLPTGGGAWASQVVGDDIYVATHTVADLYKLDTTTQALTRVTGFSGATYVWDLCTAPDGKMYAGTYPDGKVWEFDPASGALRSLGVAVPGQTYVRSIVADDTTVYAGVGSHAHLVAIDRATGATRDITPPELLGEAFVYQLAQTDTHVIAGTHGSGLIAVVAKDDPADYRILHPEGVVTIGKLAVSGTDVYFGAGDALWHLDLTSGETTRLVVPSAGDFVTALYVRDGVLVAFMNSAAMWSYDLATGTLSGFDFQAAGMPDGPELPQSVLAPGNGRVYVGGHAGTDVHDLRTGARERIRVAGEAKAMAAAGRNLYLAMYPSGSVVRYDTATKELRTLAVIGHGQNRPRDLTYDPRSQRLLVGTSPDYGQLGGALSSYHLGTGALAVYRDVVAGHAIGSVAAGAADVDVAYVGSERPAGSTDAAEVARIDLRTGGRLAAVRPVPGAAGIPHLTLWGDVLYGTTSTGTLFALDPRTLAVVGTAKVGTRGVDLLVADDVLYGVSHERLFRIHPRTLATEVVVDRLAAEPTSFPMLAGDERTGDLFTITARDLLRVQV